LIAECFSRLGYWGYAHFCVCERGNASGQSGGSKEGWAAAENTETCGFS